MAFRAMLPVAFETAAASTASLSLSPTKPPYRTAESSSAVPPAFLLFAFVLEAFQPGRSPDGWRWFFLVFLVTGRSLTLLHAHNRTQFEI